MPLDIDILLEKIHSTQVGDYLGEFLFFALGNFPGNKTRLPFFINQVSKYAGFKQK